MKAFFLALLLGALTACGAATASVEVGPSPCVYSSLGYMRCILNASTGYSVIWPSAQGNPNSLLLNDGSGNLSWSTSAAFVNPMTTLGDTMFENASSNAVRLAGNTTTAKQYLSQTGTGVVSASPAWASISAADILAGTLAVARGGTNLGSGTSGGILGFTASGTLASSALLTSNAVVVGGGAGATPVTLANNATSTNEFLTQSSSGLPAWAAIQGADVPSISATIITSGTLAVARGGTNLGSGTSGGVLAFTSSGVLTSSNALTANGVVYGGGAGFTPGSTAAGTNNQVLIGQTSSAPIWGSVQLASTAAVTGVLTVTNGGTGAASLASNGVLYGGTTVSALAVNSTGTNKFLTDISSGAPAWAIIAAGDLPAATSGAQGAINNQQNGTFVATFTQSGGYSVAVTIKYRVANNIVTMLVPPVIHACTATAAVASGATDVPAALRPSAVLQFIPPYVTNNSALLAGGIVQFDTAGQIVIYKDYLSESFQNSGNCGLGQAGIDFTFSYILD